MKKLLNLVLLVALTIGFVSCEPVENSDSKYESKLMGAWNLTVAEVTLLASGIVVQERVVSLPDAESYQSIVFDFKKDGTYTITTILANGEQEEQTSNYSVANGKLTIYEEGTPYLLDIVDITNKKLTLRISEKSGIAEAVALLHFAKL
jgi:hypothetical protein